MGATNHETTPSKYHVPAVETALDVIEQLAGATRPRSISELAGTVNKGPGSLFRIMTTLERRGYVAKDPASGRYEMTLRLLQLAHQVSPMRRLAPVAAPFMKQLAIELRQSCHLSVIEGADIVVIHEAPSPEPIRLLIDVGARQHILETLSGRVMLAGMTPAARDAVLDGDPVLRALSATARTGLLDELDEIATRGFATRNGGLHSGVDDFTAAVGRLPQSPVAALTVTALQRVDESLETEGIVDRLLSAADAISEALGHFDHDFPAATPEGR